MKVCLINPPHPYLKQPKAQAPLGLMYIAAVLREKGHQVSFVDLSDRRFDDKFDIPEAELYGLTGTILDRIPCTRVAKEIRYHYPDSSIIVGGPISLARESLDMRMFDSVVSGEGEEIIFDIIEDFPKLDPHYIGKRIKDLDALPFPARDLVPDLGGNIFAYNHNYIAGGSSVILTSRGCPHNCAFCASPGIWGGYARFRSEGNVLAEVDELIDKYNIRQLRFSDDTLTAKQDRLEKLCIGLREREVLWRASIRVKPNGIEMFQMMRDSGCREVSFGIESGDQDVLDVLDKSTTVEDNYQAITDAKKAGLVVRILFMCGTPGETEKTADKNIEFLEKVHAFYDTIALTNFLPLPGSAIANDPSKFHCRVINSDIDEYNFYMWGPEGKTKWKSSISLNNLVDESLAENTHRMREYVINSGKSNLG